MTNTYPQEERSSTDYQKQIVDVIHRRSIKSINCRNPGKQLGNVVSGKSDEETSDALRGLENNFGVLELRPSGFLFWDRSSYSVNPAKAKEVYASFREKK